MYVHVITMKLRARHCVSNHRQLDYVWWFGNLIPEHFADINLRFYQRFFLYFHLFFAELGFMPQTDNRSVFVSCSYSAPMIWPTFTCCKVDQDLWRHMYICLTKHRSYSVTTVFIVFRPLSFDMHRFHKFSFVQIMACYLCSTKS